MRESHVIEPSPFDDEELARRQEERVNPAEEDHEPEPAMSRLDLLRLRADKRAGHVVLSDREHNALQALSARPEVKPLAELLAETPAGLPDRIDGMSLVGGNTLMFASYKTGKTSLALNVARSLVDDVPFLGQYEVIPLQGNLIYWNYELPAEQFTQWLRMQGIKNVDKVIPLNLRGRPTHPQTESDFEWLVGEIARFDGEALIIDPLAVAIKGDPNRGDVATEFTETLDDLKHISGARDLFMTAHTGHPRGATRSGVQTNLWAAGHSRFMGWADVLWTYAEGRGGARLLSAKGRYDDDVEEMELAFDKATKRLTFGGWTGRRVRVESVPEEDPCDLVLQFLEENPGASTRRIRDGVKGGKDTVEGCLATLVEDGSVRWEEGPRGSHLHYAIAPEDIELD